MIERLLAAERALAAGDLDRADRLFGQVVAADSRNAIAVTGLAEVAHRRGRTDQASELVARALSIDPEDAAAERLRALLSAAPPAGEAATTVAPGEAPEPETEAAAAPRRSLLERLRAWFRRGP
ncbi:MAG TPA: tetratricopeptide repeat protein [Candidatus Limnocylindrales bacterium]|nr:tetratricopeptide repeat protein [Candidatus Limnocylindrales bacterium]